MTCYSVTFAAAGRSRSRKILEAELTFYEATGFTGTLKKEDGLPDKVVSFLDGCFEKTRDGLVLARIRTLVETDDEQAARDLSPDTTTLNDLADLMASSVTGDFSVPFEIEEAWQVVEVEEFDDDVLFEEILGLID